MWPDDSENDKVLTTDSELLLDNDGFISKILCYEGGISAYFERNRDQYHPCVIVTAGYTGSFASEILIYSKNDSVVVVPDSSWFIDPTDWNRLQDIKDKLADLPEYRLTDWISSRRLFSQRYSMLNFGDTIVDLKNLTITDRLDRISYLETTAARVIPSISESEIEWQVFFDDGPGLRPDIIVRPLSEERGFDEFRSVDIIDSVLTLEDKLFLLETDRVTMKNTLGRSTGLVKGNSNDNNSPKSVFYFDLLGACYCYYESGPARCRLLDCAARVKGEIGKYLQDRIHARRNSDGTTFLNTSRAEIRHGKTCHYTEHWADFFKDIPCADDSKSDLLCSIAGGNLFITENIVFLGADELFKLLRNRERQESIGIVSFTSDTSEIESAILNNVYKSVLGKKVVWVGTKELCKRHTTEEDLAGGEWLQPIYHIDLFFNPIGNIDPRNNDFHFLISKPIEIENCTTDSIENLRKSIQQVKLNLCKDIQKAGYNPVPIEIPLGVYYSNRFYVYRFAAFANGLFERNSNLDVNYLMPDYEEGRFGSAVGAAQYETLFSKAGTELDSVLKPICTSYKTIPVHSSSYGKNSALRCQVKVIERN